MPQGAAAGEAAAAGAASPAAPSAHIEIDDLYQTFRRAGMVTQALAGVDLHVAPGELVVVVGPSGCGKSTLLRIAAGLLPFTSGRVRIGGRDVTGPQTELGIVFQSPVLLDWRNVLENVLIQVELRGMDPRRYRERAERLLADVGLGDFNDRRPRELSGGMRQRVAIVRALIHDPPLLMMDEPFGALDALTREQMRIDLEKLWLAQRHTLIFVTHGIAEAVALADRVVVMTPRPGRIERIIRIDLPRPRDKAAVTSARFTEYVDEITECFMRYGVIRY
ncbi:MAG: ABC transporter ATP-binding protein [Betaproteobacteria bacterium]|nr:ABC transporter ATP-binding protein [Betaproteobacteria bacterium]